MPPRVQDLALASWRHPVLEREILFYSVDDSWAQYVMNGNEDRDFASTLSPIPRSKLENGLGQLYHFIHLTLKEGCATLSSSETMPGLPTNQKGHSQFRTFSPTGELGLFQPGRSRSSQKHGIGAIVKPRVDVIPVECDLGSGGLPFPGTSTPRILICRAK